LTTSAALPQASQAPVDLLDALSACDAGNRPRQALQRLRAFAAAHAGQVDVLAAAAGALLALGQWARADLLLGAARDAGPDHPEVRHLQRLFEARALEQAGRRMDAIGVLTQCVRERADDPLAWTRLADNLLHLSQWHQAQSILTSVVRDHPRLAVAWRLLGMCLYSTGKIDRACEALDTAWALAPNDSGVGLSRALVRAHAAGDPAVTRALYAEWGQRFADPITAAATPLPRLTGARRDPLRRLRVGYVSGDLREHPIAYFMAPLLAHHDPAQVEVHVYATTDEADAITARIRATVPHWHAVAALDVHQLLHLIRSHQIDVLVDLSGHTDGERLGTFVRRAAPVQVTWMGFIHTLGIQAMDYRLTDAEINPPGSDAHYVESLFRLSRIGVYQPPEHSPLVLQPPMRAEGVPTLACLNHPRKLTDAMLRLWGRILARVPAARLLLISAEPTQDKAEAALWPRLRDLGLPIGRIYVSPHLPIDDYMALGSVVDVALDTAPVSGGTTTLHALWMGVPVVTLDASEAIQAYTASLLRGLDLADWIAGDEHAYVEKVVALLADPEGLARHRATIRSRMRASRLMGYEARAREVEHAYRLMWVNHLFGERRFLDSATPLNEALAALSARRAARQPRTGGTGGR